MPLTRLMYFSENLIVPSTGSILSTLSDILCKSNRNNKPLGLTGALVFDNEWFVQVLEGERSNVWATFERIREDERHDGVTIAEFVEIEGRRSGNWWMGLATRQANTQHIFGSSSTGDRFDPRAMSAAQILGFVMALARTGLSRELAATEAA